MNAQDISGPHQDWEREVVLQTIYGFERWAPEEGNAKGQGSVYLAGHDDNGPWQATLQTARGVTLVSFRRSNGPMLTFWMNNSSMEGLRHRLTGHRDRQVHPAELRSIAAVIPMDPERQEA